MSDNEKILMLSSALAMSVGALKIVSIVGNDHNKDGLEYVIQKCEGALDLLFAEPVETKEEG